MRLVGSERVSDVISGHAPLNVARLKNAAGCDIIREEKASAKSRDGRSELETILSFVKPEFSLSWSSWIGLVDPLETFSISFMSWIRKAQT